MENPIQVDDLGVPLFQESTIQHIPAMIFNPNNFGKHNMFQMFQTTNQIYIYTYIYIHIYIHIDIQKKSQPAITTYPAIFNRFSMRKNDLAIGLPPWHPWATPPRPCQGSWANATSGLEHRAIPGRAGQTARAARSGAGDSTQIYSTDIYKIIYLSIYT